MTIRSLPLFQLIPPKASMEYDIELISFSDKTEGQSNFNI
jgi:hypothetical protein